MKVHHAKLKYLKVLDAIHIIKCASRQNSYFETWADTQ